MESAWRSFEENRRRHLMKGPKSLAEIRFSESPPPYSGEPTRGRRDDAPGGASSTRIVLDRALLERYDVLAPRYTSYPTAASFGPFSEADYRECVRSSNGDPVPRALSIYVHLPFCRTVCFYCGCNRIVTANRGRIARYIEYLNAEIALQSRLFDSDRTVTQLALGGGTPNFLASEQLVRLASRLREHFRFAGDEEGDFSIEIDPRQCDDAQLSVLRSSGFNRVSFGVQDLDPRVQRAVNRVQPAERVLPLIDVARQSGFRSINVDLIYGLPFQTAVGFDSTLRRILALRPERLSIFNYAHLPERFKMQRRIDAGTLPSPGEKFEILRQIVSRLEAAGYLHIGLDHFVLPEDSLAKALRDRTLTRNFQGYSTHGDSEILGLGMTAIGSIGSAYHQNSRSIDDYQATVERGQIPIRKGYRLSEEDQVRRDVILAIMCRGEVDPAALERRWSIDFRSFFEHEIEALLPMQEEGLVEMFPAHPHAGDPPLLRVTPLGRLLVRNIARVFDAHSGARPTTATFSRTI